MNKLILLADDLPEDELFFKRVLEAAGVRNPVSVVRDGIGSARKALAGCMDYRVIGHNEAKK